MNLPASPSVVHKPRPTPAQQQLLDRIAAQRERLRDRKAQRLKTTTPTDSNQMPGADAPLAQRLAWFTREHPVAVASLAAAALMAAGPSRLVRWAGVALPLILKLRGR